MFLLKAIHENICRGWCAYCTHGTVFYIFEDSDIWLYWQGLSKESKFLHLPCYLFYIYIYSAQCNCRAKYMHIGWNKTNTSKLLLVSCFHIHPAYTITLTRYTHYIITTKFKLLSHFLTPISTVLVNIAVNQYDATLNIIIWCFSRGIYFDSNIWKFCTLVQKILSICSRNYVLFCYAQITMSCTTSIRGGVCSYIPF